MAALSSSSSPVEARSLSSITSIAANPPAYPRNPTQAKLDRVELYIVKVPGSKDVVLTPLKPPTKSNISIDAINSSCYYLHVATDEDKDFIRSVEQEQEEQARNGPRASRLPDETVSRLNSFKRKPIGKQVAVAESQGSSSPFHGEGNADLKHDDPTSVRPAVHSSDQRQFTNDENTPNVSSADVSASKPYIAQTKRKAVASDFKIPRRPVSASGLTKTTGPASNLVESRFPWDESREESMDKASSFCITLIRRDVASGSQWNVGTISSSKGDKGIIHVEITNPGYAKFRNNIPIPQISTSSHPASPVNDWHSSADVLKKMAQNMTHNMTHAGDTERSAFSRDIIPVKHGLQGNSLTDVLFNRHSGSVETPKLAQYVSAKVNRGYYSFQSPWGGTCSFVVSVNGGSLKCKHTIPGPAITADPTHGSASPNPEVTVAELRYNIPFALEQFRPPSMFGVNGGIKASEEDTKGKRAGLGQIISTNIQKVQQHTRARSRSQGAAHIVSRPNEQGYDENRAFSAAATPVAANEDRYDFSLARELAGGGMNGKSAKLGKLIIEDEGIKMIDLVVAASMGIWWRSTYQPN